VGGIFNPATLKPSLSGDAVSFLVSGSSGDEFVITLTSEELEEIAIKSNDLLLEVGNGH